jgi:hypothetical protein
LSEQLSIENPNIRGASIPKGCKTRWGSHLRQFQKLLVHQQALLAVLQNLAASDYVDDNQLHDYCFDRDFWIHLSDLAAIPPPLTQKLHLLEGDTYVPKVSSLLVNWLGA